MDFLTLIVAYGLTFTVFSYILLLGDSNFHRHGIIGRLRESIFQIIRWLHTTLLPKVAHDTLSRLVNYLLYQRNPCFQYFYVTVLLWVVYVYTVDVLPLALAVSTPPFIICGTYFFFASCLLLFIVCSKSDPGVITKDTLRIFGDVYATDGLLYHDNVVCWTCEFEKPARSKHCATCNHCVYRFDHHCTWLNNCIGGLNARYFLALVVSLCFCTGFVAFSIGKTLALFAETSGLLHASYVGPGGRLLPVTWKVAIQHLFMEKPMPVFILMSLALLCLLVAAFMFYHLYLVATNQTTNERYKRPHASWQDHQGCTSHHRTSKGKHPRKPTSRNQKSQSLNSNIYDRGLLSNISEFLLPLYNR